MTAEPIVSQRFEALRGQLGQFAARMLEEALLTALPATWERRAATLLDARPRPGDFHGRATRVELSERWHRLTEQAEACMERARLCRQHPDAVVLHVAEDAADALASEGVLTHGARAA